MAGPSSLLLLSPVGSPTDSDSDADDDGLEFTAVDSFHGVQSQDGSRYSVDLSALIHHGTTRIFRGTLSADGIPYTEVVCKVGTGPRLVERIRHEARLYRTKLAPLQGRFVPRCFGLFEGVVEGVETSCLVLSYEGEPTQHSLHTTGIDFRYVLGTFLLHRVSSTPWGASVGRRKAVSALQALHKVGVAHGDFNERSIVLRPTSCPVLVGFGGAVEHCCNLRHPSSSTSPSRNATTSRATSCTGRVSCLPSGFPVCAFILSSAYETSWQSLPLLPPVATVEFLNCHVPIRCALEGCDSLMACAPKGTDPDLARMHAEMTREDLLEWIEERELYDGQPLPIKLKD
ncbi:uncharacterized protein BXZ73DRAFT_77143 [Epithele typhae]|uniref:uncharacterized protein n=1 Tax=Epithele typhae TaxID=378194 RepID=UPI002008764E|nr:uncharacterized protein BXZ73DRAFT_77143 [Epithele typhae]KAH9934050.1 hypothetical protein BXZ73DRAFT_77143 [Epithele typhae]